MVRVKETFWRQLGAAHWVKFGRLSDGKTRILYHSTSEGGPPMKKLKKRGRPRGS